MLADSSSTISPRDRELARRLTAVLLFLILMTAATSYLWRLFSNKFHDNTGAAEWIWAPHRISRNTPVVFFAVKEVELPPHRAWARIKILGDPEYTLYFNGRQVGSRRIRDSLHLDVYDVSALARDGTNRIVVAVRSTTGVGGLIASVDIAPEAENVVVSGKDWKIFGRWDPVLPFKDAGSAVSPMTFGEPPAGRWNYLGQRPAPLSDAPSTVLQPLRSFEYRAMIPTIRIRSGIAVSVLEPARATAYDFGPTSGHVRLVLDRAGGPPPVVRTRLANAEQELAEVEADIRSFVFGEGETSVINPEAESFRYVVVYGGRGRPEVVR